MKRKNVFFIIFLLLFQFFASFLLAQENKTRSFCNESGLYGIIDEDFNVIIPAKFSYADEFSGKYANVRLSNDVWALVDKNCNVVLEKKALNMYPYSEGWVVYQGLDFKYNMINEKGDYLYRNIYSATSFSEGLASIKKSADENCFYINSKGETVIYDENISYAYQFEQDYAEIMQNAKTGVINKRGEFVIPAKYSSVKKVNNDLWAVFLNDSMSLLDIKTKDQVDVGNVRSITFFDENRCFINLSSDSKIEFRELSLKTFKYGEKKDSWFIENTELNESLFPIRKKNKAGKWVSVIEDVHGNQIVDMEFDMYCDERNGIFYLKKDGKNYYVNQKGVCWSPE